MSTKGLPCIVRGMTIELIVSDWNGTLFGLFDGETLMRRLGMTAVTDGLRETLQGRVWKLKDVVTNQ
jgi:hypothetical protein